jgi:hypothetical protein
MSCSGVKAVNDFLGINMGKSSPLSVDSNLALLATIISRILGHDWLLFSAPFTRREEPRFFV